MGKSLELRFKLKRIALTKARVAHQITNIFGGFLMENLNGL